MATQTTLQQAIEVQYDEDTYWAGQVLINTPNEVDVVVEDQAFLGIRGKRFTRFTFVPASHPTHPAAKAVLKIKETRNGGETWTPGEVWDTKRDMTVRANYVDVAGVDAAADFIREWIVSA